MPLGPSKYPYQKPRWPFQLNRDSYKAQGLQLWAPGDPGTGGKVLYDHSGNNRHGTMTNFNFTSSSGWTQGIDGGNCAIVTDGVNDICTFTGYVPAAPLTCSFWYKAGGGQHFIIGNETQNVSGFFLGEFSSQLLLQASQSGSNQNTFGATLTTGLWYLVACTISSTTSIYSIPYKGAGGWSKSTGTAAMVTGSTVLNIGQGGGSGLGFQSGTIEDVHIWNRILTQQEIYGLYDPATRWQLRWTPSGRTVSAPATTTTSGLLLRRRRMAAAA